MQYTFYHSCVDWPGDVDQLIDLIDNAKDITRRTFLNHVDRDEQYERERLMGYHRNFPMSKDWHVTYHVGKLAGEKVYFFQQSGIEYVFRRGNQ